MNNQNNIHITKSIRLKTWDYTTPWWYFVTIVTKNHKEYFGEIVNGAMRLNNLGVIVEDEWLRIAELRKNIELDYSVVMPNHFHGIIISNYHNSITGNSISKPNSELSDSSEKSFYSQISPKPNSLSSIKRSFKSAVTKRAKENNFVDFTWQPRFYDRIIRNERELFNIRNYIEQNPLKWEFEKNYPENVPEL
ncbi:MAG TPA: hypothetical protein PKA80_03485 [Ignavibacteriaceae bacterium]|nr:hypothetical protein [Ignavibacteriaceae bacterium]